MCGIRPAWFHSQVVVEFVDTRSPAFEAGVRQGDVLLEVNGKPAAEYDLEDLRSLLRSGDGQKINITFRHTDYIRQVTIILKRAI